MVNPQQATSPPPWEGVLVVDEYYDKPIRGAALYGGGLHAFDCEFTEWNGDVYLLRPIEQGVLSLTSEKQQIFARFLEEFDRGTFMEAFQRGELSADDWGALPPDRARFAELKALLARALRVEPDQGTPLVGDFRRVGWAADTFIVRWFQDGEGGLEFPAISGERFSVPTYRRKHASNAIAELLKAARGVLGPTNSALIDEAIAACARLNPYDFRTGVPSEQEWIAFHTRNDEAALLIHAAVDRFANGGEAADLLGAVQRVTELLNLRPDGWVGEAERPRPWILPSPG